MKRTIDDIAKDYSGGSLIWDTAKVFQAVSDIQGLIVVIRAMQEEKKNEKETNM